jgi:hypothetical protein
LLYSLRHGEPRFYLSASIYIAKARGDAARGIVYDDEKLTVGEYLERWLEDCVRDTVRQRTHERYESLVRVHIKPSVGSVRLKALT